jgi:CCR4-NOT transcription complex subunit 9
VDVTWCLAAVLQVDDTEVINFLLSTEIIPLCLRTMEMGSELSKTVATFIVQKILLDGVRLASHAADCKPCFSLTFLLYICHAQSTIACVLLFAFYL